MELFKLGTAKGTRYDRARGWSEKLSFVEDYNLRLNIEGNVVFKIFHCIWREKERHSEADDLFAAFAQMKKKIGILKIIFVFVYD